jgi:predicted enzyme related to lactoylglutathione lyase
MADASTRGQFVWYDLRTTDDKSAQAFYTKVANWGTQPMEGMPSYVMWTANGQPLGGVMKQEPGEPAPPHWLGYIGVPDVDATVKQAQSLGGRTIVPGTDIPTVGRFAILADPQGAVFAVFSGTGPSSDGEPAIGGFSWHELATTDYKKAFEFYSALFGWEKQAENDMGPIGVYFLFKGNGREMGGIYNITPDMKMPPNWMQYVRVDSADAAVERVKANGGTILNGPMEVPGGDRIAQCMDPQGAAFAVHSRAAAK